MVLRQKKYTFMIVQKIKLVSKEFKKKKEKIWIKEELLYMD